MRRVLSCSLLALALLAGGLRSATPAQAPAGDALTLLDQLHLGLSRGEMMESVKQNILSSLEGADPGLQNWVQGSMNLDSLVGQAFSLHEPEWTAFQSERVRLLASRFSQKELQELTKIFSREPVQRLFQTLELPDSLVQQTGDAFFLGMQGDVQRLMEAGVQPYLETQFQEEEE